MPLRLSTYTSLRDIYLGDAFPAQARARAYRRQLGCIVRCEAICATMLCAASVLG